MNEQYKNRTPARNQKNPRLSKIQIAIIIVGALVFAVAASFAGYLIYENALYQQALRNYPVAYSELILQFAEQYDLDPYLVQSVMRCESSNDPGAVSDAGAIGLMQIMPDTATWIAHKLDLDDVYTQDMLYLPETSIEFGCWYLHFLSGRFNGNVKEIVAAYNAGHGSVEDWLADPRFSENGVLVTIPFEQTARYYEKVMEAYENYTTLYPDLFTVTADQTSVAAE
ncbi:MAG: lytic transglycosylase domain-containing protein [Eubacteriales bacterium]|nr:lytic transglycosylase domain-containing protein [Eubacteriales bacterium]